MVLIRLLSVAFVLFVKRSNKRICDHDASIPIVYPDQIPIMIEISKHARYLDLQDSEHLLVAFHTKELNGNVESFITFRVIR